MLNVDWGSAPDWLQAVGGLFAVFFAAWAVKVAISTNRHQARQIASLEQAERGREMDAKARYASNVAGWVTILPEDQDSRIAVRFVNSNPVPIYDVTVFVGTDRGSSRVTYRQVGPTAKTRRRYLGRPARALESLLPSYVDGSSVLDSGVTWIVISFRDPAGSWWLRDARGRLWNDDTESQAMIRCIEEVLDVSLAAACSRRD